MNTALELRLKKMEKRYHQLRISFLAFISLIIIGALSFSFKQKEVFGIIRAKGIIIEDSIGRDRILIGSPIPYSKNRVRTDTALVRKYWAKNFGNPDQYMKWYKDYYHGAEGIVIMNENGFDRLQLGDKLSDPNTGRRMFEPSGLLWNDREGWERGGAGVNTTEDGQSRSVVGLDDDNGEAVHLVALEDGTKGLMIAGNNGHLLIGMSKENGSFFQNKEVFSGIKFFDSKGKLLWEQALPKTDK
ncbi:hypothetical protein IQ13_3171 [Lacibacter cauensis]|uniref:Uncharacterized protein n=1 Tax=Lacibacter cauensis TaxID=510947 RepID=A0A562SHS5_9BACT|nr:hypothetical protein [Lacibacter cauensis]TWI80494.1 hypothetical protein IQ13_3171 [Lacibacter cauensis]